jgi:2-oxoglutarate ferredoxin oxidoreductase subunit alpha
LRKWANKRKKFIVIENNTGQMVEDVKLALMGICDCAFFANMPGKVSTPEDFIEPLKKLLEE